MAEVSNRARPDPSRGVFETLLVLDGQPVHLDAHLARLHASLTALYPDREPPGVEVPEAEGELGAMRITVLPETDGSLEARVSIREVDPQLVFDPLPVSLGSFTLPGGLGPHKWADRSVLDTAQIELGYDKLPLIVDEDGAVLEAARANVFAVRDGVLSTPPLDGRILPGITRAHVMKAAAALGIEAEEVELGREDLLAADEVFLTGSVRGVECVRALDDAPLATDGEVTARIAAELRPAAQRGGSVKSSLVTR